ncbi:hypothetical protein [Paracoccus litorisediminis]|uniref:Uncharacterized protein n=1 Tax=Paracoccus litorisediminis TaxID=2006130 RepID=A0A844HUG0_9RHOB|nr:hypothetical protein [Paracoccus litorisediminis]MTH61211.1 hypothetical protein [Paracoccus litorisediminis]
MPVYTGKGAFNAYGAKTLEWGQPIEVTAASTYSIFARVRSVMSMKPPVMSIGLRLSNGTEVWGRQSQTVNSTDWVELAGEVVIPTGITSATLIGRNTEPLASFEVDEFKAGDVTLALQMAAQVTAAAGSAQTAATKATEAGQHANAASSSATTASTKASEASTSAGQASAAKSDAESAQAAASTSAGLAVTARQQAEAARDGANTAQTGAETAASAAQQSKTDAAASATAAGQQAVIASGHANTATTKAGEASTSASQAAQSKTDAAGSASAAASSATLSAEARDTAQKAINRAPNLPATFEAGLANWTMERAGSPETVPVIPAARGIFVSDDADFGSCLEWASTATAGQNIMTRGVVNPVGRQYRITVKFKVISTYNGANTGPVSVNLTLALMSAAYVSTQNAFTGARSVEPNSGVYTLTEIVAGAPGDDITYSHASLTQYPWMRAGLRLNDARVSKFRIQSVLIEDVTAELAAKASAKAAASSATSASASATASDWSAQAAASDKLAAETARGQAQTARTEAVTAKENAEGAANAAAISAGASATSANDAGDSATAASTSAQQAASSAGAAGESATAAATSATTANTKAGEASTSATQAAQSKNDAAGSASNAATSATTAAKASSDAGALARGNLILESVFDGVDRGRWYPYGGTLDVRDAPLAAPSGRTRALFSATGDVSTSYTHPIEGGGIRTYRLQGYVLNTGTATARMGVRLTNAAGGVAWRGAVVAPAPAEGAAPQWVKIDTTVDVDVTNYVLLAPWLSNTSGTRSAYWTDISIEDVTESAAAAKSATASANSATAASASATGADWSAQAAASSELNAATARGQAQIARDEAVSAKEDAEGAENAAALSASAAATSASNAGDSASAAASSASTANTKATEAGQSATTASTAANTATTKAGEASTSATQAAQSKTDAAGSAQAAATSATTSATVLSAAQIALNQSKVMLPSVPKVEAKNFSANTNGGAAPDNLYGSDADGAFIKAPGTGGTNTVGPFGVLPLDAKGKVYRVTIRFKHFATAGSRMRLRAVPVDAAGVSMTPANIILLPTGQTFAAGALTSYSFVVGPASGGLVTHVISDANWKTAPALRMHFDCNGNAGTAAWQLYECQIEDVTAADEAARSATGAAGSASAAATSETNAAASSTAAGTSATAANTAKLAAETAKGAAETARTEAVTAKDTAKGSENAASLSAQAAAQSKTDAGNSATAAAGSASTANTKATEASQSATAANTAKTAAETARGQAQTSATNAATSETNAAGSASAAATSAGVSASARDQSLAQTTAIHPSTFAPGLYHWTALRATDPLDVSSADGVTGTYTGKATYLAKDAVTNGPVAVFTCSAAGANLLQRGIWNSKGRAYRVTARFYMASPIDIARGLNLCAIAFSDAANYNNHTLLQGPQRNVSSADGIVTMSEIFTAASIASQIEAGALSHSTLDDSFAVRFGLRHNPAQSTELRVISIDVEDVTEASKSARASANSATSAQASATAADWSAQAAASEKLLAETARGQAQTARTEAVAAKESATQSETNAATSASAAAASKNAAGDSASAAATSASSAGTKATEAAQSATAANTAKTAAETARGQAQTAATNAATSETNAAGSASAAGTSAGAAAGSATLAGQKADAASTSAQTATTKASEAGQSATAAGQSATTATTKAGEASTSATQAAQSKTDAAGSAVAAAASATVAASTARALEVIPSSFTTLDNWTNDRFGSEAAAANPTGYGAAIEDDADMGKSLALSWTSGVHATREVFHKKWLPCIAGRKYRITFRFRIVSVGDSSTSINLRLVAAYGSASFGNPTAAAININGNAIGTVIERSVVVSSVAGSGVTNVLTGMATYPYVRFALSQNHSTLVNLRIGMIRVEDVTDSLNAAASASAAATSASNASASESAAGASATAANTAKLEAETARGQAQTHATNAASSRDSAAGSASDAATSAGAAAGSATISGEKADAASISAQTATTKASEAGVSAAAANTSKVDAETARGLAQTAAGSAATSETNAAGSASAASAYAKLASLALSNGMAKNPTFLGWTTGSLPPDWGGWTNATSGTISRVEGKYGNAVKLDTIATSTTGPYLTLNHPAQLTGYAGHTKVLVSLELEWVSGDLNGLVLEASWASGDANSTFHRVGPKIQKVAGIQTYQVVLEKPAATTANSFYLRLYGSINKGGAAYAVGSLIVHRMDLQGVVADSYVDQQLKTKATVDGLAESAYIMRVKSGGASAGFEMVAASDAKGGSASAIRMSADEIIMDGTLKAPKFAAGSVTASKVAIGDMSNLILDSDLLDPSWWTVTNGAWSIVPTTGIAGVTAPRAWQLVKNSWGVVQSGLIPVEPGMELLLGARAWNEAASEIYNLTLGFYPVDAAGVLGEAAPVAHMTKADGDGNRVFGTYTVPAGVSYVRAYLTTKHWLQSDFGVRVTDLTLLRRMTGELLVNGAVKAIHLDTENAVITGTGQIANAIITDAHIFELSATKLKAGTALAGSLTIDGSALSTVGQNAALGAQDPATRINNATTKVKPGLIEIFGATTLLDWQGKSDKTTINGGRLETNSVLASSMAIGDTTNLVPDSDLKDAASWTLSGGAALDLPRQVIVLPNTAGANRLASTKLFSVEPNFEYFFAATCGAPGVTAGSIRLQLRWADASGNWLSWTPNNDVAATASALRIERSAKAPANARFAAFYVQALSTVNAAVDVSLPSVRVKTGTILMEDGAITGAKLIKTEAVITETAQIKELTVNEGHFTGTLSAAKLRAGTALAGGITVDGTALSAVKNDAATGATDPALRINTGTTKIDPGRIVISGGSTLLDWQGVSDKTTINGGKLETGSVTTGSLRVGITPNLIVNGGFDDTSEVPTKFWVGANCTFNWTGNYRGSPCLHAAPVNPASGFNFRTEANHYFGVQAGETLSGEVVVLCNVATPNGFYFRIEWLDGSGNQVDQTDFAANESLSTGWKRFTGSVTVPSGVGAVKARIRLYCNNTTANWLRVGFVRIQRQTIGVDIADGAVSANHVDTVSFSASGLAVFGGTLKSDNFDAGAGTGWRITRNGTMNMPNAIVDTLQMKDGAVSLSWSANSANLSITASYPMRLIVLTNVRVEGVNNGYSATYSLKRNGTQVESTTYSVSPYSWTLTCFKTIDVGAGTHAFNHSYTGDAGHYTQYRIAIFGTYK